MLQLRSPVLCTYLKTEIGPNRSYDFMVNSKMNLDEIFRPTRVKKRNYNKERKLYMRLKSIKNLEETKRNYEKLDTNFISQLPKDFLSNIKPRTKP